MHLDKATFNWSWENDVRLRKIPIEYKIWPYDLLIDIAKADVIGNCFL